MAPLVTQLLPARDVKLEIPQGVRRSQEAFWRELPDLMKEKSNLGKRVCYHGDELIGIARSEVELIRECLARKLEDDQYYIDTVEQQDLAPWETDEIPAPNPAYFDE